MNRSYSLWVSSSIGSDESGVGTEENPFRTIGRALKYNYNATQLLVINLMDANNNVIGNWELEYVGSLVIQKSETASFNWRANIWGNLTGVDGPSYFLHGEGAQGDTASCLHLKDLSISFYRKTAVTALNYMNVEIDHCEFLSSGYQHAPDDMGGALLAKSSLPTSRIGLSYVECSGNGAGSGGCLAVVYPPGGGFLTDNCVMESNNAAQDGGAIYSNVSGRITQSNFTNNVAGIGSGGAYYYSGSPATPVDGFETTVISMSIFYENQASSNGGAVAAEYVFLKSASSAYQANHASYGGAIYVKGDLVALAGLNEVSNNVAQISGGGIYLETMRFTSLSDYFFKYNECKSSSICGAEVYLQGGDVTIPNTSGFFYNRTLNTTAICLAGEVSVEFVAQDQFPGIAIGSGSKMAAQSDESSSVISLVQATGSTFMSNSSLSLDEWSWYGGLFASSAVKRQFNTLTLFSATCHRPAGNDLVYYYISNFDVVVTTTGELFIEEKLCVVMGEATLTVGFTGKMVASLSTCVHCKELKVFGELTSQGNFTLSGGSSIVPHSTSFLPGSRLLLQLPSDSSPLQILGSACFEGDLEIRLDWDISSSAEIAVVTFLSLISDSCKTLTSFTLYDSEGRLIEGAEFYFTEIELVVVPYPEPEEGRHLWMVVIGVVVGVIVGAVGIGLCLYMRRRGEGYEEKYLIDPVERVSGKKIIDRLENSNILVRIRLILSLYLSLSIYLSIYLCISLSLYLYIYLSISYIITYIHPESRLGWVWRYGVSPAYLAVRRQLKSKCELTFRKLV